jgi:hypothetical protein
MENLILYSPEHPIRRVGKNNDGGYVICSLPDSYDLFISGGISNDISFEQHFLNLYPSLKCYAFDGTINSLPSNDQRITFVKKNLGKHETPETTNLKQYMDKCDNIFMKIDIEGHEFRLFPELENYMSKIKQLVLEIHSPGDIKLHPVYFKGLSDIDHEFMFKMFAMINKTHTLVHVHANNGCAIHVYDGIVLPNVFECTFIRNDFVTVKTPNKTPLPLNIDMKNISSKPDYSINYYPFVN